MSNPYTNGHVSNGGIIHQQHSTSEQQPTGFKSQIERKISPTRFQVSKSPDRSPEITIQIIEPSSSVPHELDSYDNTPLLTNGPSKTTTNTTDMKDRKSSVPINLGVEDSQIMKKVSSAGRFMIINTGGPPETSPEPDPEPEPPTTNTKAGRSQRWAKNVQFTVEVEDKFEDEQELVDSERGDNFNETLNMKSWRRLDTLERPPAVANYKDPNLTFSEAIANRPTMQELLTGIATPLSALEVFQKKSTAIMKAEYEPIDKPNQKTRASSKTSYDSQSPSKPRKKFGWIEGVFFRCLLNIFGVMLYLRISWVAGQAGMLLGTVVVLLASLVTTITALSTCAICTNGDVKGGGAYFLISRSLGPEFGGSIGLIFSVANAVGAAMYVVGFAETVRDLLKEYGMQIFDGEMNDVRVVGLVTCVILMGIVFIGTGFESKMQMVLLVILSVSILDYLVGTFIPINDYQKIRGITGYSISTIAENILPKFRDGHDFFSVFSIYFPAATGIMAGANISGDLADPQRAIPLGTLLAIAVTTVIYVLVVWMTGSTCVRDADGINFPTLANSSTSTFIFYSMPDCAANSTCPYGLLNYFQVMEAESVWGPLITAGIFAATLSSALASLVSAPKVFQAVCKDRLFPYINFFAKGYGKNEEPRRAYALAFVVAMAMILIGIMLASLLKISFSNFGDLNAIAPIISNFFLASYALINYACFDNSFVESPGFRPGFRYYNMWISLLGALLCVSVMFIISWFTALLTFFVFGSLFFYISRRKPDVNWGSSQQAHSYRSALQGLTKLDNTDEHVKNYRPQILVLTGNPAARPSLVDFVYNITKGSSLMICGYVVPYSPSDQVFSVIHRLNNQLREWLRKRRIKSFYISVANQSLRAGVQALIQVSGLGKLRPNILVIGFKHSWASKDADGLDEINEYFGIIQDSFDNNMGVAVLRNAVSGLDYTDMMKEQNLGDVSKLKFPEVSNGNGNLNRSSSDRKMSNDNLYRNASKEPNISEGEEDESHKESNASKITDEEDDSPLDILNEYLDEEMDEDEHGSDEESTEQDPAPKEVVVKKDVRFEENVDVYKNPNESAKQKLISDDKWSMLRRRRDNKVKSVFNRLSTRRLTIAQKELLTSINRFQRKVKKGTIDVWWLYDDGGLSLLIPYLLTVPKSYIENAKLRIFTISTSSSAMEQEQRNMASLLSKFRIGFSDVNVISDINRKPSKDILDEFQRIIEPFRVELSDGANYKEGLISEAELSSQKDRTMRQLRIAELLRQHSSYADLVVLTLPVPRKGLVSSCLYMAWLDMMTRDLPPTLLIRGNQSSVLTFYS